MKAGLVNRPEDWSFSNYLDWIKLREGTLKDDEFILDRFDDVYEYQEFVNDIMDIEKTRSIIQKYLLD